MPQKMSTNKTKKKVKTKKSVNKKAAAKFVRLLYAYRFMRASK